MRVEIATGRTHQIRVHAKSIGHPVAGDDKYGNREENRKLKKLGLARPFLHASRMELPSYKGKKPLVIEAPLAQDLATFLKNYEKSV